MSQREQPSDWRSNVAVEDANDIKQKTRLIELLEAMHEVPVKKDESMDDYVNGNISKVARNIIILESVKDAIVEAYNLLIEHYRNTQNGVYWLGSKDSPLGYIEREKGEAIVFWGLRDILMAEELYTETWVETTKPRNMPVRKIEQSREYTVPKWTSMNAYYRLKEFLDVEHGLDLQFEAIGSDREARGDYSDIFDQ